MYVGRLNALESLRCTHLWCTAVIVGIIIVNIHNYNINTNEVKDTSMIMKVTFD